MIHVRPLATVPEFQRAVELQREIWQFDEIEILPVRLFVVAAKVGGQVFGAFDGGRMIGFCIAIPGVKPAGTSYLHSDMLGVLPGYRDRGVGRMLKLAQRDDALARGMHLIEWTFDPLEIKNARFNLERLGAVVRRYVLNQYGVTTSQLHAGLPTDRCVAEWHLASPRVASRLAGVSGPQPEVLARIQIPLDVETLHHHQPRRALEFQRRTSEQFVEFLGHGWAVTGLETTADAAVYLFTRWESS